MKFEAKKGFSLIELMVVVAIIGILSVVGVPKYQVFKAKSITSEAVSSLAQIYTVQQAYFMDRDQYAVMSKNTDFTSTAPATNVLGYVIPATSKYNFTTTGGNAFVATAAYKTATKLASCSTNTGDTRTINENKTMAATVNGLAGC